MKYLIFRAENHIENSQWSIIVLGHSRGSNIKYHNSDPIIIKIEGAEAKIQNNKVYIGEILTENPVKIKLLNQVTGEVEKIIIEN